MWNSRALDMPNTKHRPFRECRDKLGTEHVEIVIKTFWMDFILNTSRSYLRKHLGMPNTRKQRANSSLFKTLMIFIISLGQFLSVFLKPPVGRLPPQFA